MPPTLMQMSFAGHPLIELGKQRVSHRRHTLVNSRHIPGSDRNYIDIGGRPTTSVSIQVFFDNNSELNAFQNRIGTQGSLMYSGGTHTALLEAVTSAEMLPDGGVYATLDFVIL